MIYPENFYTEDLLDENLIYEDLLDEDLLDEGFSEDFDESRRRRGLFNRRPIRPTVRPAVAQSSNFGRNVSGNSNAFATKSELKQSLDAISKDLNELKRTTVATTKAVAELDKKHSALSRIDTQKNDNQSKVLRNMQNMSMIGSLLNQPKLKPENLEIIEKPSEITGGKSTFEIKEKSNAIHVDKTMSLMLPMMTTMGGSKSGSNDMMMPMMLMLMNNDKDKSSSDNMMPLVMMMMMQNQK
jgi:hypothetical protein